MSLAHFRLCFRVRLRLSVLKLYLDETGFEDRFVTELSWNESYELSLTDWVELIGNWMCFGLFGLGGFLA